MKKIILSAVFAVCAFTAQAQDYYAKVALGWAYLPDNKVTINTGRNSTILKSKGDGTFITGALGFGSSLYDNFRGDLELYMDDGIKGQKQFKNSIMNFRIKTIAGFGNVFYDMQNSTKITPFIMAGLGYANNKTAIFSCTKRYHKTNSNLAFQLGAGAGYMVNNDITLEFGYRYIDKGIKNQMLTNGTSTTIQNHPSSGRIHTFLVGTRIKL